MPASSAAARRKPRVFYPFLLALYPILYLFTNNLSLVVESEVPIALVISLLATAIIFVILCRVLQDRHRAAAITSIVLIVFFSYGHLYLVLSRQSTTARDIGLFVLVAAGIAVIALILWRKNQARRLLTTFSPLLHLMAVTLLIFPLFDIGSYIYRTRFAPRETTTNSGIAIPDAKRPIATNSAEKPDVYFMILDGYGSNDFLMKNWGYDNSDFTDELAKRGFFVAPHGRSAYGETLGSIPTTLNMRYLEASDDKGSKDNNLRYVRSLLADSTVAQEFQKIGYKYVYLLSGFSVPSHIADLNVEFFETGPRYIPLGDIDFCETCPADAITNPAWYYRRPFLPFLLETTLLRSAAPALTELMHSTDEPYGLFDPHRALMTWDEAEKVAEMPEATFTFIHILKPHDPVVFDGEGNILPERTFDTDAEKEPFFFDQLKFVNQRTLAMIDAILQKSSTPPIIIIQGDHGTRLGDPWNDDRSHLSYFDILSAFHFPGGDYASVPENITSVNTFRVVFDTFFGGNYELLPNHHYDLPQGYDNLFNQQEVTLEDN